jgi:hypothetical protein
VVFIIAIVGRENLNVSVISHTRDKKHWNALGLLRFNLSQQEKWNGMYSKLRKNKNLAGHCDVPYEDSENPELAKWVSLQHVINNKGLDF